MKWKGEMNIEAEINKTLGLLTAGMDELLRALKKRYEVCVNEGLLDKASATNKIIRQIQTDPSVWATFQTTGSPEQHAEFNNLLKEANIPFYADSKLKEFYDGALSENTNIYIARREDMGKITKMMTLPPHLQKNETFIGDITNRSNYKPTHVVKHDDMER